MCDCCQNKTKQGCLCGEPDSGYLESLACHACGSAVSWRLLYQELICHIPFTVMSMVLSFVVLSLLHFLEMLSGMVHSVTYGYHVLFHIFHYIHILFAVIGTYVMFMRHSSHRKLAVPVALVVPAILCTLSDAVLPAGAGFLLGVRMDMHICFLYPHDLFNMLMFMFVGLACAYAIEQGQKNKLQNLGIGMHFFHILASSLASLFYMVSYGFDGWVDSLGMIFFYLTICVIVPCILSDLVVPLYLARLFERSKSKR